MIPYENYVTPSCDWIDKIPSHWATQRIKTILTLREERSYKPMREVNLISLYAKFGVRQHKDIEHTTGNKARNADGYKVVYPGDIVVNILLCWMGSIGRSEYYGVTSPAYDIYRPRVPINTKFFNYIFRTPMFAQQCYRAGKGIMAMRWRTYSPQFSNIVVPIPPREEQDQIVRYLDWKVSKINKLIANRRKEIASLEELKTKLINDAVTKGLRNRPLTHSEDIRWNISYCSTWGLKRIRELFSFRKGLSITKANLEETGIPVINYGQIHSKKNNMVGINDDILKFVNPSYLESNTSCLAAKGDFIFADTSEDKAGCGNCAYVDIDGCLFAGYHSIVAHPLGGTDNKYFAYLFRSPAWRYQIRKRVNGVKVYSITQQILKDAFVLLPPEDEQHEIVTYLDSLCQKINALIKKTEEKIDQLHDLKAAIISKIVTGKIDIRNVVIPEYEYEEEALEDDYDIALNGEETEEQED